VHFISLSARPPWHGHCLISTSVASRLCPCQRRERRQDRSSPVSAFIRLAGYRCPRTSAAACLAWGRHFVQRASGIGPWTFFHNRTASRLGELESFVFPGRPLTRAPSRIVGTCCTDEGLPCVADQDVQPRARSIECHSTGIPMGTTYINLEGYQCQLHQQKRISTHFPSSQHRLEASLTGLRKVTASGEAGWKVRQY
jgi:hypothetical protein